MLDLFAFVLFGTAAASALLSLRQSLTDRD